jgi:GTP-binding protein HflX
MELPVGLHNFLLVSIIPQKMTDEDALIDLKELKSLVEAFGGEVRDLIVQRREITEKGMYIGKGKIDEIADVVKEKKIHAIVLNAVVKPGQLFEIKSMLHDVNPQIQVWDRIDLILQIFSKHANTAESKLQIELAAMRHMGPRIYGMGMVMSRQGGGIGGRGVGETNTELMKRHWSTQMKKVQEKLAKLSVDRERQLERRARIGLKTVSIVGYTNAGKTSLFNVLTGKGKVADNALFVTLDSSVGKIKLPKSHQEILMSDTIGFINNLPTTLIDAFKSTLMESIHADLLLHVIDVTDHDMDGKIRTVEKIISDLGMYKKERVYVFNKIDIADTLDKNSILEKYERFSPLFISTKSDEGIQRVIQTIEEKIT